MQIDKGKLKQGTRVALDMTTLTIMRFVVSSMAHSVLVIVLMCFSLFILNEYVISHQ